jgi:hypothetical protein
MQNKLLLWLGQQTALTVAIGWEQLQGQLAVSTMPRLSSGLLAATLRRPTCLQQAQGSWMLWTGV